MKKQGRIEITAFRRRTTIVLGNQGKGADAPPPDDESHPDSAGWVEVKEVIPVEEATDLPELAQRVVALIDNHNAAPDSGLAKRRRWRAAIKGLKARLKIFRR